mgnify:CR=1 FL=1
MAKELHIQRADNNSSVKELSKANSSKKFPVRVRMSMKDRIAAEKSLFTRLYLEEKTKIA